MDNKYIVALIVGFPSIVGMSCILYSIFYEKEDENIEALYKPKQPLKLSYDDELDKNTGIYSDEESEDISIDYMKENSISIFEDS